jgi:hypothetical protein
MSSRVQVVLHEMVKGFVCMLTPFSKSSAHDEQRQVFPKPCDRGTLVIQPMMKGLTTMLRKNDPSPRISKRTYDAEKELDQKRHSPATEIVAESGPPTADPADTDAAGSADESQHSLKSDLAQGRFPQQRIDLAFAGTRVACLELTP